MMYNPPHFQEIRTEVLHRAMRGIGFATLVSAGAGDIDATHLPLLLDEHDGPLGTLSGHFARPNPHWKQMGETALAMFLGPHFYVSPGWYATKQESGKVVPTWNYIAVHARGVITIHDDADWLGAHLQRLTEAHESGRAHPWTVQDAPESYVAALKRGIVGFSLKITALDGKWKMSQNREPADREGVRAGLAGEGRADLAALVT